MSESTSNTGQFLTLAEIALRLGIDRSAARKYLLKEGVSFSRVRLPGTRGQQTLALAAAVAEEVIARRRAEWSGEPTVRVGNGLGFFYVVQLVPDLSETRVKLGFATSIDQRMQEHRCAAPTARVVRTWPCRFVWEAAAIASITRMGCRPLSNEAYDCDDLAALLERAEAFFSLMPTAALEVEAKELVGA